MERVLGQKNDPKIVLTTNPVLNLLLSQTKWRKTLFSFLQSDELWKGVSPG